MEDSNNNFYDKERLLDRGMDEFIGICKGLIFDGIVTYDEAKNLLIWLESNKPVAEKWPASNLYKKLIIMLATDALSTDDEGELLSDLIDLTGNPKVMISGNNPSSQLPLCKPAPEVYFENAVFVITGNLEMGTRKFITKVIESLGGEVSLKTVRMDTNFLVIGDIGSKAWMHSTHGRKIERAIELRDTKRTGLNIISETHFMESVVKHVDIES